jgi:hypothetical protein
MNKSTLIKTKAEFENSAYVKELNLQKNVAFAMFFNDKVNNLQNIAKEQKQSPQLNLKKVEDILNGLGELNALVQSVVINGGLSDAR